MRLVRSLRLGGGGRRGGDRVEDLGRGFVAFGRGVV